MRWPRGWWAPTGPVGLDLIDCEIVGPAVLMLVGENVAFDNNRVDVAQFWELQPDRPYLGGIGLRDVTFQRCTFRDVGIAGHSDLQRRFGMG